MNRLVIGLFALVALTAACDRAASPAEKPTANEEVALPGGGQAGEEIVLPRGVPSKVARVLRHIDETGEPPEGYVGGRRFLNAEKRLPVRTGRGRTITYHEWDVNPHRPGVNRGPERLVTGSDGSAYYTGDHYRTFKRIR
jgi:ribonuclease T1